MISSAKPDSLPQSVPNRAPTPLLVSVREAAGLLSIGETSCWRLIRSGELPSIRLYGRVLVPIAGIEALVADRLRSGQANDDRTEEEA